MLIEIVALWWPTLIAAQDVSPQEEWAPRCLSCLDFYAQRNLPRSVEGVEIVLYFTLLYSFRRLTASYGRCELIKE